MLARAQRGWALDHPHLYRPMMERPLPLERLDARLEQRPAAAVAAACGGDPDRARAAFGFAHGMAMLELAGRFPPEPDLDRASQAGIAGLRPSGGRLRHGASPAA